MARKHFDNKADIIRALRECQRAKASAENNKVPFFGMAVICNYVLWKSEGFGQARLEKYNQYFKEIAAQYDDDLTELNNKLWDKADFAIELNEFTGKDICNTNCNYLKQKFDKMAYHNNLINFESGKYIVIFFNVMMEYFGYGKVRLERLKDEVNALLNNGDSVYQYEKELREGVGVYVERPFTTLLVENNCNV